MKKRFPIHPSNPERVCWGCDQYCPAGSLRCGNGTDRTQHPVELFGEDWMEWGLDARDEQAQVDADAGPAPSAAVPVPAG